MNVREALKPTGKAIYRDLMRDVYVEYRGSDNQYWWSKQIDDSWIEPLDQHDMLMEYIPYYT